MCFVQFSVVRAREHGERNTKSMTGKGKDARDRRVNARRRMRERQGDWKEREGWDKPKPSIYENVIRESVVLHTNSKINKGQLNGSAGKRACGTGPMAGFDLRNPQ